MRALELMWADELTRPGPGLGGLCSKKKEAPRPGDKVGTHMEFLGSGKVKAQIVDSEPHLAPSSQQKYALRGMMDSRLEFRFGL